MQGIQVRGKTSKVSRVNYEFVGSLPRAKVLVLSRFMSIKQSRLLRKPKSELIFCV
jgi:hypothetical protein